MTDPASLLQSMRQLQKDAAVEQLNVKQVKACTDALLTHFRQSAEAAAFNNPLQGPELLAQIATRHASVTLVTVDTCDLERILFEYLPANKSTSSDKAKNIVDTARAFYIWLKREQALEQADDIIDLLNDDATRELRQLMGGRENNGPDNALMTQADAKGVDLSNQAAVDAYFICQMFSDDAPGSLFDYDDEFEDHDDPAPAIQTAEQSRTSQKKRKKNRKAARKARKKNR
ncbi:MAG: hypothetical protein AB8B97_16370 [Granulosicoccus sp.]